MPRLTLAMDPELEVDAAAFVAAWDADEEARRLGQAELEEARREALLPGIVELVVIPLLVNVGGSVLQDVVKRLVGKVRGLRHPPGDEFEVAELTTASGDRLVVVRSRRWDR
jgi:hypothetical protein